MRRRLVGFAGAVGLALLPTLSAGASIERAGPEEPGFVVNRICLYVIQAREGQTRVVLPPLRDGVAAADMDRSVAGALAAVERVRDRYRFNDFEVVSQSLYLLEAIRSKDGDFTYRLQPVNAVVFDTGPIRGRLQADTRQGQLALKVQVDRLEQPLLEVSLLMDPGRPLVLARELDDGEALFTVVTTEGPAGATLPRATVTEETEFRARAVPTSDGAGAETVDPDPERVYFAWDVPPRLIDGPHPAYPDIARRAGVDGTVVLQITLGIDGRVEQAQVVRSTTLGVFDETAREAVLKWRYEPARIDGRPVRAVFRQTMRFTMPRVGDRY
jgi:TonB family protein